MGVVKRASIFGRTARASENGPDYLEWANKFTASKGGPSDTVAKKLLASAMEGWKLTNYNTETIASKLSNATTGAGHSYHMLFLQETSADVNDKTRPTQTTGTDLTQRIEDLKVNFGKSKKVETACTRAVAVKKKMTPTEWLAYEKECRGTIMELVKVCTARDQATSGCHSVKKHAAALGFTADQVQQIYADLLLRGVWVDANLTLLQTWSEINAALLETDSPVFNILHTIKDRATKKEADKYFDAIKNAKLKDMAKLALSHLFAKHEGKTDAAKLRKHLTDLAAVDSKAVYDETLFKRVVNNTDLKFKVVDEVMAVVGWKEEHREYKKEVADVLFRLDGKIGHKVATCKRMWGAYSTCGTLKPAPKGMIERRAILDVKYSILTEGLTGTPAGRSLHNMYNNSHKTLNKWLKQQRTSMSCAVNFRRQFDLLDLFAEEFGFDFTGVANKLSEVVRDITFWKKVQTSWETCKIHTPTYWAVSELGKEVMKTIITRRDTDDTYERLKYKHMGEMYFNMTFSTLEEPDERDVSGWIRYNKHIGEVHDLDTTKAGNMRHRANQFIPKGKRATAETTTDEAIPVQNGDDSESEGDAVGSQDSEEEDGEDGHDSGVEKMVVSDSDSENEESDASEDESSSEDEAENSPPKKKKKTNQSDDDSDSDVSSDESSAISSSLDEDLYA